MRFRLDLSLQLGKDDPPVPDEPEKWSTDSTGQLRDIPNEIRDIGFRPEEDTKETP